MSLQVLLDTYPFTGELVWIGIRPAKNQPLQILQQVEALRTKGLVGDHYSGQNGRRQVTLFQWEHLTVLSALLGASVSPDWVRRNLMVAGINLLSLKHRNIRIGEVVLQITGLCHPCSKMEKILGPGGYNVMRGHGRVTARIVQSGYLSVGDRLTVFPGSERDT